MESDMDVSELSGLAFRCLEGCALCCLCQPQLAVEDMGYWQGRPELAAKDGEWYFQLRGGSGPCVNLVGRKCSHYQHRPYVCRAFPFHIHAGWRLQVYADRSCRGITRGAGADGDARALLDSIPKSVRDAVLKDARARYHEFKVEGNHRGVYQAPSDVRKAADRSIKELTGEIDDAEMKDMARSVFGEADRENLPVYIGQDRSWNVFQIRDGDVLHLVLDEDGTYSERSRVPLDRVKAPKFSPAALKFLRDYLTVLNNRDVLYCEAARYCQEGKYQVNISKIYLSLLDDVVLDVAFRAALLMTFLGFAEPNAKLLDELIVFYDWDFLDREGVGLWV